MTDKEKIDEIGELAADFINNDCSGVLRRELQEAVGDSPESLLSDIVIYVVNCSMPGYLPDNPPMAFYGDVEDFRNAIVEEIEMRFGDDENVPESVLNNLMEDIRQMPDATLKNGISLDLPDGYVLESTRTNVLEVIRENGIEYGIEMPHCDA